MQTFRLFFFLFVFISNIVSTGNLFAGQTEFKFPPNTELTFVECSPLWDKNSICLSFNEKASSLSIDIVFVNEYRQKIDYPNDKSQVVELYAKTDSTNKRKEVIKPGGPTEALLISLLTKTLASEKDGTARKNIAACIECLEQRNQPWKATSAKFVIDDEAFKQRLKRALSPK